jgi:predicted nucleic acid-binding protein
LKQLILDAGPLIGLFYSRDTYHQECVQGFAYLRNQRVALVVPIPILFEVYKWLLQRTHVEEAQQALAVMTDSFHPVALSHEDFGALQAMVLRLPDWKGSLEDGTVVMTALRYQSPLWTYNYRDLAQFKSLEFWTPASR